MNRKELKNYLSSSKLDSDLSLDKSGALSFHWADWSETCLQKTSNCDLKDLNKTIETYQSVPLWMHYNGTQMQSTLYDLYNHYLAEGLESRNAPFFISIGKQQGPYINFKSLGWVNEGILKNIVYHKLLEDKLRRRHFRLYWKSRPNIYLDNFYHSGIDVNTHAITPNGLIFKVTGRNNTGRILNAKNVHLDLDLNPFIRTIRHCHSDFINEVKKENFSIHDAKNVYNFVVESKQFIANEKELEAKNNNHFHLFLPYSTLRSTLSNFYIETPIKRFLENTRNSLELDLIA